MPHSSKKVFEFLGVKSNIEYIHYLIVEYNNSYREEFVYPLFFVKFDRTWDGDKACEEGLLGCLFDDDSNRFYYFGYVGMVMGNNELINIRGVCDDADYNWAISYFATLGDYLRISLGININSSKNKGNGLNPLNEKPEWFPKKEETLQRWKMVYQIIIDTELEYEELDSWEIEKPKPTLADLSTSIKGRSKWTYSEKQIRRIRQAGRKGWLE